MASVNKAVIIGHVGKDPETRYSASGAAVCNITVATSRKWKDKEGQQQEEVEWHRVVAYDKLAEIIGKYLVKGSMVYFEGRLKTRKWTDKQGVEKYTTEIVAQEMTMLGGEKPKDAKPAARPAAKSEKQQSIAEMESDVPW